MEQYGERWAALYFSGLWVDQAALLGTLDKKVAAVSAGWRRIDEYLNKGIDLRMGFGLLMRGPITLVDIAAAIISDLGGATSIFSGSSPAAGMIAAIMGSNAIVASAFRFERRDSD